MLRTVPGGEGRVGWCRSWRTIDSRQFPLTLALSRRERGRLTPNPQETSVRRPFHTARCIGIAPAVVACAAFCLAQDYLPMGSGNGTTPFAPPAAAPTNRDYGIVPGPATRPMESVRPESWPGAGGPQAAAAAAAAARNRQAEAAFGPGPAATFCEGAQILARAGNDVILVSDVQAGIDDLMTRVKDKLPPDEIETQRRQLVEQVTLGINELLAHLNDADPGSFVDPQRRGVIRQLIKQQIEIKLVYQDFRRTVPSENLPNVEEQITRQFEQTELKKLLKREDVTSRDELERKLRAKGRSLEREKRLFIERVVHQQWVRQQIKIDDEITHAQMVAWYQSHLSEFEKPAKARWEELMVRFSKFPTKQEAYQAIAGMGNQVLAGVPPADVAKAASDGLTAAKGGLCDWTTKGSLVAQQLDSALFGLPIGHWSPILEGPTGYHIIRVVERQEATRTPFLAAQKEVREKIRDDRSKKQYQEYLARIQQQFPVWTIFDNPWGRPQQAERQEPARY